jgi:phosphomannomutase/phosphoglucomutase
MDVPAHIFREYDIRGVVDVDLRPEVVMALGKALGSELYEQGIRKVGVGRDVRPSGVHLSESLREGIRSTGCDVVDYGQAPTPAIYHAVATGGEGACVAITGSHNPPEYNGFKIALKTGAFYGEQIQAICRRMRRGAFHAGEGKASSRIILPAYIEELAARARLARKPRFAYDPGNGAAALVCKQLFAAMGLSPVALFDEPDGTFPNHHPDPTVEANMADLRRSVAEHGLEFGVAYDGDADRIGVVDERGEILWGDQLLILYARDLLRRHAKAPIIFDVKCSDTLPDAILRAGGTPIIWKTGHSLVKTKMKETGALLAGEMSGHMFFGEDWYGFDDAILATVHLLSIVSASDRPLSEHLADVPKMASTPEIRIDCPDDLKFEIVDVVRERFRTDHEIIDIDGVRVRFESGWALLRASNTQPALVMRAEALDEETLKDYVRRVETAVAAARTGLTKGER